MINVLMTESWMCLSLLSGCMRANRRTAAMGKRTWALHDWYEVAVLKEGIVVDHMPRKSS